MTTLPVGEQDVAYIQKHAGDFRRFLHRLLFRRSDRRCHRILAFSGGIVTPSQCGITRAVKSAVERSADTAAL
jgi:hypothetical protein